ncbi:MAG: hypothetical protein JRJ62_17080 [Deltaproteobacteria bacterium]|nr:hypothetical protein [Deltaproteobacteria bacterium]
MKSIYILAILFLCCLGFLFSLSCERNCPQCPEDPVPESYYVYFADNNGIDTNYIWIADSQTDSIIDSIKTRSSIRHIDVSLDGNYMAATMTYDSIFIIDLETHEIISKIAPPELIGLDKALFSHDGNNIIINSYQGKNTLI